LLTVGRIVPEKRQFDLVRAFKAASLKGWKLVIVGGADHASSYAAQLLDEVRSSDDIIMAGFCTGEKLRQLYTNAGVFVLPSSHEGLPIALLEAMSYGLPCLASNIPSNLELIDQPDRIFDVGNIDELARKMTDMANAPTDVVDRDSARRAAVARYDWSIIAYETAAVYSAVMADMQEVGRFPTGPAAVNTSEVHVLDHN
jgi:glycosyltransferase involved in cell wall biosynthesis